MNNEIKEKLDTTIRINEGEEQPLETMTFTYDELIKYVDLSIKDFSELISTKILKIKE